MLKLIRASIAFPQIHFAVDNPAKVYPSAVLISLLPCSPVVPIDLGLLLQFASLGTGPKEKIENPRLAKAIGP